MRLLLSLAMAAMCADGQPGRSEEGKGRDVADGRDVQHAIGGRVLDPRLKKVEEVFRQNFADGLERGGASFAVYHNGKLVLDLWGGVANPRIGQFWTEHSMSILFSTTKSISATVLAYVLDKAGISYDEKVSKYWPEFTGHGKENLTILQVTLHQAGVPYSDQVTSREDVLDWRKISKYLEDAIPVWEPGTQPGYHALTIGFLFDQIVRRIDPQQRGISDIFKQEFANKYGLKDVGIGLSSKCENNRVALLRNLSPSEIGEEGIRNPEALRRYLAGDNEHNRKLYQSWPWITVQDYNVLENRLLPMPSNMGIGNANGLAHFHSLLAEKTILSPRFYELYEKPVLEETMDVVIQYPESKGYGYQFTKNPRGEWVFGHSGFGGQNVRVDTRNHLSYAYVANGLKIADADMVESWKRLVEALYEAL